MSRIISRAESYEKVYEAFQTVNFSAFDFNTIKESLLEYMKLYFPEDFNDYIESSEFIAVLELFAYVGELMAYRIDVNAHENFLSTAQRKESVLRLAKLISYGGSRNIPNRGLVKITSISTTEAVFDSNNNNLAGRTILWNDANNPDWKEQFFLVMNHVLQQPFGTVTPADRVQVDDVLFELYTWNNNPISTNGAQVFPYSVTVAEQGYPMELVPSTLTESGPEERRPERSGPFSLLYGNDGLGDASDTTGFFLFTKQGSLQKITTNFDGVTPNQTYDILVDDINNIDVYVNNIDSDTGEVLSDDGVLFSTGASGFWVEVDVANGQNIIFNTNTNRRKYEIETLQDDNIRLVFGDGEFAEIPNGSFDIWYRTSANANLAISQNTVVDQSSSFTYNDVLGNVQTFNFAYSLIQSLQNGSASEDIDHIREVAPSVYYTQDRMVNARDYSTFMLQDPSIVKLLAVNRTFAGDSKYIAWHDPSQSYENVKVFGDDSALYYQDEDPVSGSLTVVSSPLSGEELLSTIIQPYLSSTDFFLKIAPQLEAKGILPGSIRREFNNDGLSYTGDTIGESDAITTALNFTGVSLVELWYTVEYDEWTVGQHPWDTTPPGPGDPGEAEYLAHGSLPPDSIQLVRIEALYTGSTLSGWDVRFGTRRLVFQSQTTQFWNTNDTTQIVEFDTLNVQRDRVVVLEANVNANESGVLPDDFNYDVLGMELVEQNLPNAGLPDIHKLNIIPVDTNEDGIADNLTMPNLLNKIEEFSGPIAGGATLTLTRNHISGRTDNLRVWIVDQSGPSEVATLLVQGDAVNGWVDGTPPVGSVLTDEIVLGSAVAPGGTDIIRVEIFDYVYFQRESSQDPWIPVETTDTVQTEFALDDATIADEVRNKRHPGRYPLNFSWFHYTSQFQLVDPAASNIIDQFIITQGYLTEVRRFLDGQTSVEPDPPTSLSLRTTYADLLDNKMISDTVVLHTGKLKVVFGPKAQPELRARFEVIRPSNDSLAINLTDNEVKVKITEIVKSFLDVYSWEFGETFYFSELSAAIHRDLGTEIDSIVIVPLYQTTQFGDLYEIPAREDEILIPDINTTDIEIVQSYTPENIRQQE